MSLIDKEPKHAQKKTVFSLLLRVFFHFLEAFLHKNNHTTYITFSVFLHASFTDFNTAGTTILHQKIR